MKIKVEQRHIDAGTQGIGESCPIALALAEAGFDDPSVDEEGDITFRDGKVQLLYCKGRDMLSEIVKAYDEGHSMQPFEFSMDENSLWKR